MQDLGKLPLVVIPVDYCRRKVVEAKCTKAQIKAQLVRATTSPEGILQPVAEGVGRTILPERYVRLRLAGSWLRILDLYDPAPRHSAELAYCGNRYQHFAARERGTLCRTTMTSLFTRSKHSHRGTVTTG
ncbi:MAG: hypothetical protein JJE16_01215 [Nitrospiraceae bacterium]|nr:hypothetical protein [Nitrospiraceae bacterium]